MFRRSVTFRLAVMFVIAFVVIVSIYGLLLRISLHDSLANQMHNELSFRANLIEPWITSRTDLNSWEVLVAKLSDLTLTEGGRVTYWIFDSNNQSMLSNTFLPGVNISDLNSGYVRIPSPTPEACSTYLYIVDLPTKGLRYAIGLESSAYMGTYDEFTRNLVIITVFGLGLIALLSFVLVRIGMKPVHSLSEQAQHLAPDEHGMRLDSDSLPVELKELAVSFNGVLDRQEVAWQQLDSFNSDVAHELKTPLTNLIGQTQLALSSRQSTESMQDILGSNLEELERMTSIVNDMLFLSRAYAGENATNVKKVSLREEADKTIEYVSPLFFENDIEVAIDGDVSACIDYRLFNRALANLLSNSARYAKPHSCVKVKFQQVHDEVHVSVSNVGDTIEPTHLSRLFERFYRMDSARKNSHAHHGLGLSIVKAVALMHGGTVFATSEQGTNTFGFTLSNRLEKCSENIETLNNMNLNYNNG
ncbi:heavy metal sensor histidine kinase [Vibrio diazotrophicus]|uniref:heavy metal sensor histidine kinase n=1 Tax=Vibrio diazotrophicus TaxID=685 RepID=UPI0005A5D525|nr:heavy metal sensor histidine kinase [Vibrio diazotrophicus]